jgi:uncharacterized metal-binding protein
LPDADSQTVVFVSCPGGSNVSLMSYKAATILEKQGYGKFVKLAGDKFKEKDLQRLSDAAKYAEKWVLIEGCTKGCGKKALDGAGINPNEHIVVTNLGIERENKIDYTNEELDQVLNAVKAVLG